MQEAPICFSCAHLFDDSLGGKGNFKCKAFPDGVPESIRSMEIDHDKPVDGDNGIQFEKWEPNE